MVAGHGARFLAVFGTFRYILAILVAFGHIQFRFQGQWNWAGVYSVFGFFALSGFLMTRVLHQTYGYSPRGFASYLANRALRIYPAYWAALVLTLVLLKLVPDVAGGARDVEHMPATAWEWAASVAILGLHGSFTPRVVPTAWSLHVELIYYALLGLGLSRWRLGTAAWVAGAVAWTAWSVAHGLGFGTRFSTVAAAALPFSLGAALHFVRVRVPTAVLAMAMAAFLANLFTAGLAWGDAHANVPFYSSLGLSLLVIAGLRDWKPGARIAAWDERLGHLSYPIFLMHSQVGYWMAWMRWVDAGTFAAFAAALPLLHGIAVGMHAGVVAPLEALRRRVRQRAVAAPDPAVAAALRPVVRALAPLVAVSLGLFLVAAAGEGALRLLRALAPPPRVAELPADTRGVPKVDGIFGLARPNQRSNYKGALYTTNSRGLRGPEVAMPKPEGVFRIANLGDSYAMGSGVRDEEAFAAVLARAMPVTPAGGRVDSVNLGLAGLPITNIVQQRLSIALDLQSDLLVYNWVINDIETPSYRRTRAPYRPPGPWLLANLLRERWNFLRDLAWPSPSSYMAELDENYFHNPAAWGEFEGGLDRLAEAGREGGTCVVTYLMTEMQVLSDRHPYRRFYDAVAEASRRRGIHVIESLPAFLGRDPVALRCAALDWHPNAEAHAILGEHLARELAKLPAHCWKGRRTAPPGGPR